jgi:pimeloyl-ACP methyl ester carboxylesterase
MSKSNPTWVLIRGLARESRHWGEFPDLLAKRTDGEIVTVDLPGAGEFRNIKSPRNLYDIYKFVREKALERVKSQPPVYLMAISLGGMIAMEWMKNSPQDLAGCVLINTSSKAVSPAHRRLRWQIWGEFLRILTIRSTREREKAIINLVMNSEEAKAKALPAWYKLAHEEPMSYFNVVNQLMAAARFADFNGADVPVLELSSLGDRLVDPSCSQGLSERFHWPLERHPWAGHDLTWDDTPWVLDKVEDWLANVTH